MRSYRAQHNLFAVSANNKETAINTEQTLDTTMLVGMGDIMARDPRREDNGDELTGHEESTTIYDLGDMAKMTANNDKAQPQHFAFYLAYALGLVSTAAAGSGYQHTITPITEEDGDRSVPTFTAAQRLGSTIFKRRYASVAVDAFTATFAKDSWAKLVSQLVATGKTTTTVEEETVAALDTATSLALAANAVHGSTAAERLQNVQQIRVNLSGDVWTEVEYTAVSAATPAVITIVAPGAGAVSKNYKILYAPTEPAWATFPAEVTETPLRVSAMTLNVGGTWDGSAFQGGRELTSEVSSVEWAYNNNLQVEFTPGAGGNYAGRIWRDGRQQALKLNRELRDYILQMRLDNNETFGVYILCEGAIYDSPHKFQIEVIFPLTGLLSAPLNVDGKRLAEAGDLKVLEDATYGSVIVKIKNQVATYAA